MPSLREELGLRAPKVYKNIKESYGVDPELLYGVELEIEGLEADEDQRANRVVAGMQYHKDGSLRNNGGEFVTLPMNYANLENVLRHFFKVGEYTEENYSERCSVHVHANCQDLTPEQVRLILCLYQVTEKILFQFIKADRDNNIFCVPLGESNLGTRAISSNEDLLQVALRKWRKYTALNLLPLASQGTLEFRHMAGTKDVDYILQWCNIIGSYFRFARANKFDDVIKSIMTLNTSSAYATFMQNIFDGELYDVLAVGNWREYLEEGVINMKCMLSPPPLTKKKNPDYESFAVRADAGQIRFEIHDDVEAQEVPWPDAAAIGQWLRREQVAIPRDPRLPRPWWSETGHREWQNELDRHNLERLDAGFPVLPRDQEGTYLTDWLQNRQAGNNNPVNPAPQPRRRVNPG